MVQIQPVDAPNSVATPSDTGVDYRLLASIVAFAVGLRVVWAWLVPVVPVSDSMAYDAFARTLVEHGVFGWNADSPLAFWPPGTTFLHALIFYLFGSGYTGIVVLNILLSAGVIITTYRVADRYHGARIATATTLLIALWPTLVMYPTILASELPFLFFTILALDIWTSPKGGILWRAIGAGLVLGFASLVRPLALLLPFIYTACCIAQQGFTLREVLRQAQILVVVGILMAIVIAPWTWRNYQLFGEPVLISTNGSVTLWMGNAPGTDGRHMELPEDVAHLPENERARVLGDRAREYIREDPAAFVLRSLRKLLLLYNNESTGVGWNHMGIAETFGAGAVTPLKRLTQVTWAGIFLLALLGLVILLRRKGLLQTIYSPIVMTILYYSAVHSVVVSQERYHLGFASQIAILSAIGMVALKDAYRARQPHVNEMDAQ